MASEIATLVLFDTETTGLPPQRPRIMELCMTAVQRKDMQNDTPLPRVLNQLLLCFNPQKLVSPQAAAIAGLSNATLEDQGAFTPETCQLVQSFLAHLKPPVCLVAHNGDIFDFRLLLTEFSRCRVSLPADILCADSLKAFRSLDRDGVIAVAASPSGQVASGGGGGVKKKPRLSYRLGEVYRRVYGSEANEEHTANGDTRTLLMCAKAYSPAFLQWLDKSAVPLETCVVMYIE